MSTLLFDSRCAVRALSKNSFGVMVIVTLALGIGSNTAMFSIANAILLRPLPYVEPSRLIAIAEINATRPAERAPASAPSFVAWQAHSSASRLAAFRAWGFVLTGAGEPERLTGARASADLFPVLGIGAIIGRTFSPEEDRFGGHHVVLLSEGLWKRRFGADRRIAGRSIVLSGESYVVAGVVPAQSTLIDADVWVPLALEPFTLNQPGTRALTVIGRLNPGATLADAQGEIRSLSRETAGRFPDAAAGWDAVVVPLTEQLVGSARPMVLLVSGAVALLLLIACANTANLLLARGAAREHEVAVCVALGASRIRIVRRLLMESIVLALLGGLAGIPIAFAGLRLCLMLAPAGLPRIQEAALDPAALVFTFAASLLTGVLFGIVPALHCVRPHASLALRETAVYSAGGGARSALRNSALACQVALAVLALVVAGLLVRSFRHILAVDPGFESQQVQTLALSLPEAKYADATRRVNFFHDLLDRVESIQGVASAGLVSHLPLSGRRLSMDVAVDPARASDSGDTVSADTSAVTPGFFTAMRIALRKGRLFSAQDAMGSPPVVVINEAMARRMWPGQDAIGRRLVVGGTSGADPHPREVIGVVADVRASSLEAEAAPQIYVPLTQNPWPTVSLVVRITGGAAVPAGDLRAAVLAIDADQPVYNVRSLDQVISRAVALRRFQMLVLALSAVAGLVLAIVGVYSVVAYTVTLRTREIGLRLALGAQRRDVLLLVIRGSVAWAGVGMAIGGALAIATGRMLQSMLFGTAPSDPVTFTAVLVLVAMLVVAESVVAGRRAAGIDPLIALRHN